MEFMTALLHGVEWETQDMNDTRSLLEFGLCILVRMGAKH